MATQLKEVRIRIASIKNTLQITKAMKMASVNKLKKSQAVYDAFQVYFQSAHNMLANLLAQYPDALQAILKMKRVAREENSARNSNSKSKLFIVISSDKGLCGGYNTNLFKHICQYAQPDNCKILSIGKKAGEYFQRRDFELIQDFQDLYQNLQDQKIANLIHFITENYLSNQFSEINLAHTHFVNPAIQTPQIQALFPLNLGKDKSIKNKKTAGKSPIKPAINYEDAPEFCAKHLLRIYLSAFFYNAILDAQVAEHSSRVNAMEQATENANKISEQLKISYNRARQSLITKEVIEIISGAASL